MILDARLIFADAQASTVSVAATDIVDTVAKGDAYVGDWLVVRVDTAYTSNGTATRNTFQLQTSDDATFADSTSVTLLQSTAYAATTLTAGKFWAARIPMGTKRYLRVYKALSGNTASEYFTAGKFDAFIVADITNWSNRRFILP